MSEHEQPESSATPGPKSADQPITSERRGMPRFDKAFPVFLSGERGITYGVARNVSEGGMYVELADSEPIGSKMTVTFAWPGSNAEMSVEAEVRYAAALNFGDGSGEGLRGICGVGLRFVRFLEQDLYDGAAPELASMH